jgi:glycine cleavage system H protein
MKIPENCWYTRDHEWARFEEETAMVGITDYAQETMGDVTFIELPTVGQEVTQHAYLGSVESSKAASDVYSPIAGSVMAINETLRTQPELINKDPYGEGWICKVQLANVDAKKGLMSAKEYAEFLKNL